MTVRSSLDVGVAKNVAARYLAAARRRSRGRIARTLVAATLEAGAHRACVGD